MAKKLSWGETPFDDLSRDELLLLVRKMYSAIVSTDSAMSMTKAVNPNASYWTMGTGHRCLQKTSQILDAIHSEYDRESIYRAFYRYADDLLFENIGSDWVICQECGIMIAGRRGATGNPCENQVDDCDGVFRALSWKDLAKDDE